MLLTLLKRSAPLVAIPVVDGPWRLLSAEYPKPSRRELPHVVWPQNWPPPEIAPPPRAVTVPAELEAHLVETTITFHEQIVGGLAAQVRRPIDPEVEAAIAFLLAA